MNLLIVESLIKQKSLKIDPVDESKFGVDLNQNGKFDVADEIKFKWEKPKLDIKSGKLSGFSMSYVGLAKNLQIKNKVQIAPGLYPLGTEFLHSVRYIDINGEKITPSKRMKELRYGVKKYWQSYGELLDTGAKAIKEKRDFPDRIEKFIGNVETGLNNNRGWFFQGFIEDKKGDLHPQNYEESVFCMGCHSNIGALTDSTFVFARKFEKGAYKNGWYHGSKRGFEGIKDFILPNGKGEYALYLYLNNAGDEFRSNDEIMQKFFVSNWRENKDMIKKEYELNQKGGNNIFVTESLKFKNKAINILKNDISYLIMPSPKRAMRLNKTYKTIVDEQSFVFGRDSGVFENVHKSVKEGQKTGIKAVKF